MQKDQAEKSLFWADQLAQEIAGREKFHYLDKPLPKLKEYVVKTAASVSGVLHIGRLSDTIRCDSVFNSLCESGKKARLIWVADNMDPLRKIPKGVPESYSKYIGVPVTDVPDLHGCHKSYAEHHVSKYLKVIHMFVSGRIETYSMREEYKKGSFREEIGKIIRSQPLIVEIQNRYRPKDNPVRKDWFPWMPVCGNCGKIITTKFLGYKEGFVKYQCSDYKFEKHTAKGCGHKGEDDPLKGNGKLLYKSELAAQWARWKVCTEGFGKEYQVPGSAFWINGEIAEKALGFPMPVPIFYEHLMIDNEKMSASKGNVIYPADWLKVAPPELIRFLYNKKLMKTRSFSWSSLPLLYDDYDMHERVFFGKQEVQNEKERQHMKRLYAISQISVPKAMPAHIPFDFVAMVSQIFQEEKTSEAIRLFISTGHLKEKPSASAKRQIKARLDYARRWAEHYAPEQARIRLVDKSPEGLKLSQAQKESLKELAAMLEKKGMNQEELHSLFWEIAKKHSLGPQDFFRAVYLVLLGKESGPKLAPFILAVGQKKAAGLLRKAQPT